MAVSQAHDQLLRLEERARVDEAERAKVFGKRLEAVQASRDHLALQSEQQARLGPWAVGRGTVGRGPWHRGPWAVGRGTARPAAALPQTPTDASALTPTASPSARPP